ncbi:MAG: hypothetical protein RLZZ65_407 [Bacteroidota bacterium]
MKFNILLLCLLFFNWTSAQLMNKHLKSTYPSQYYFETTRAEVFRNLNPNTDFLPQPLGERANEIPLTLWSQQVGLRLGLSKHSFLDAGISFLQNGEAYSWGSTVTDSSFAYQTRYRYLALPVQYKFAFGQKVNFQFGGGLIPGIQQSFRQDLQWSNALGAKSDDQIKVNNELNGFVFSWVASAGVSIPLNPKLRFGLGAQIRQQLNNTYNPYQSYIHKSQAWGITMGLYKNM